MADHSFRLAMLSDNEGRVLVLLPRDRLLNLASIWKHSNRHLHPLSAHDAQKFFAQSGLNTDSGLKKLFGLPVFLDADSQVGQSLHIWESSSGWEAEIPVELIDHAETLRLGLTTESIDAKQPEGDDVTVITRAVEKFTALRIKQRLEDTLGLPTLPPTAQKVIMLRSDPNSGVDDLIPIVKFDPSLSAQVMSWAASPFYAAPGGINSIQDAIVRVLGFDLVVNLALGIAMGKTLKIPEDTPRGATPYWVQAVYCATLSERLVKMMPVDIRPRGGLAYLSGLLHNFGYLALAHIFPPHFSLVSRYVEANPHLPHEYVEKQVINVTREQVGAWLMEIWKLPDEVCRAIRYQSDLSYTGEHRQYAMIVNLAQRVMRQNGIGDGPVGEIPPQLLEELSLEPQQLQAAFDQIHNRGDELKEITQLMKVS
ncbi:HDOD domain-containing protein [Motiliproteus sediminis]|uniref:HDOD domain-containing protein n=1 Tax=Motiliproteus sediminis TaxID=1468178 RepID=UPI001AF01357|nr:HDOD domain-containing protein [Motiliproteus sediminis]